MIHTTLMFFFFKKKMAKKYIFRRTGKVSPSYFKTSWNGGALEDWRVLIFLTFLVLKKKGNRKKVGEEVEKIKPKPRKKNELMISILSSLASRRLPQLKPPFPNLLKALPPITSFAGSLLNGLGASTHSILHTFGAAEC